jgi:hypothetical protein
MRYYSSTASEKTLSSAVASTDTEIGLNSTTGLPASYPFTLVLNPDTASEEIVLVTGAGAVKTYAVTRGLDTYQGVTGGNGTSKTDHSSGDKVKHMVTARDLQEPQTHMDAASGVHGVTGSVVGTSDTQTLTNKSLTSPTITGTIALPSSTSIGTVSSTEIGYLDGVTSAIQTQLTAKSPLANPAFTGNIYFAQPSPPTTKTGAGTLTIAELLTGIIDCGGGSGYNLSLPSGTSVDAGVVSGLAVDNAFEWSLVNRGGGTVTVVTGVNNTMTGSGAVAVSSSGLFRTRKTATNSYITYRIA